MPQYLKLPNGALFPIQEGESDQEATLAALEKYPEAFGLEVPQEAPAEQPESGFTPALRAGYRSLKGDIAALAGRTGAISEEEAEAYRAQMEQEAAQIYKPTEEGWAEAPLTKIGELAGGSIPYMAAPIAAGAAAVGAPVLFGGAALTGGAAALAGGAAAGTASLAQYTGSNLSRQMEDGRSLGETDLGVAASAAIPQAALDVVSFRMIPGISKIFGAVGKELTEAEAKQIANQSLRSTIADYTLKTGQTMGVEGLTETAQQALERLQAGLEMDSPEARDEFLQSFVGGAVLGGILAPAGRFVERGGEQSRARQFLQEEETKQLKAAADAEEAARSTPEALLALGNQFDSMRQQLSTLNTELKTKPKKNATDEEKQAYADKKAQRDELVTQFKPVAQEYNKRKDAVAAARTQRTSELETAIPQESATATAGTDMPGAAPYALNPTTRLLYDYQQLNQQVSDVEDTLAAGPSIEEQEQLTQQLMQLQQQQASMQEGLQSRGAPIVSQQEHQKAMDAAEKARLKSLEEGDWAKAQKAAEKVKALQAQNKFFEELNAYTATPVGGTLPMFTGAAEGQTAPQTELKLASAEGAAPIEQPVQEPATAEDVKASEAERDAYGVQTPEVKQRAAEAASKEADFVTGEARPEAVDLRSPPEAVSDLFSTENMLRTAYQNGDPRLLSIVDRTKAQQEKRAAMDENATERERLVNVLDSKLGAKGTQRTRKNLFADMFDSKAQAEFENGTYQGVIEREKVDKDGKRVLGKNGLPERETVKLQDIYDREGSDAAAYESLMADIEEVSKKATTRQGNAKKSLVEQAYETYDELEALKAQQESGIAKPVMREKVAALQAKMGKGEAPAERQMDAGERYQLQRRIDATQRKYEAILGKLLPIRDQVLSMYGRLYETKEVKAPATERAEKEATLDQLSRRPAVSRTARTQARIERGDVRKEAEASSEMRDLAKKAGQETAEHQKWEKGVSRRLNALRKKYGPDDKAVAQYRMEVGAQRTEKAIELGKKTPEYKARLKEKIKETQAAFASASASGFKQQAPSKRTPQVTRKQSGAPKRVRTASTESRAEAKKEQEAFTKYRGSLMDFAEAIESEKQGPEDARFLRGVEGESVELSSATMKHIENNDVRAALESVANDKRIDNFSRIVAKALLPFLDATNIEAAENLLADGKEVLGAATSKNIFLSRKGGLSTETLLHEAVHAAAERVVQLAKQNPAALTREQTMAINELKAIHARVKADPKITSANAKRSLSEFVAEVMSNRVLQKQLAEKPWRLSDMWRGIKSAIMRMVGLGSTEDVSTMFGASAVAIEKLFVPSSVRDLGLRTPETRVSRKLSAKDIAALHDGSNSMKQFADQFGPVIKQKDRTPEDVERIAAEEINRMVESMRPFFPDNRYRYSDADRASAKPAVAMPTADTLDYKSATIMSDGKPYDETNPVHFLEAEPATFVALDALKSSDLREREARAIRKQRAQDFQQFAKYMGENYKKFTAAESALVAKAATKYSVISDSNGRLKLVEIRKDNRHNIAVLGEGAIDAIIQELRAGKNLKAAFLDGLQKNADESAKNNERLSGWKKFDQADTEEAAIALNQGAAGTSWCTGGAVSTARSQIAGGDFYIYYNQGKPEVAVRMNGADSIGEVRGNTPHQALNAEQRKIARDFLSSKKFDGADEYLSEMDKRDVMLAVAKEDPLAWTQLDKLTLRVNSKGEVRTGYGFFGFRALDGYSGRPSISPEAEKAFMAKVLSAFDTAYENGYMSQSEVDLDSLALDSGEVTVTFNGKDYVKKLSEIKQLNRLEVEVDDGVIRMDNLQSVKELTTRNGEAIFPKLKNVERIDQRPSYGRFKTAKIVLPKDARISRVTGLITDLTNVLTIEGPEAIDTVELLSRYGDLEGVNLRLPDTLYFATEGEIGQQTSLAITWKLLRVFRPEDVRVSAASNFIHAFDEYGEAAERLQAALADVDTTDVPEAERELREAERELLFELTPELSAYLQDINRKAAKAFGLQETNGYYPGALYATEFADDVDVPNPNYVADVLQRFVDAEGGTRAAFEKGLERLQKAIDPNKEKLFFTEVNLGHVDAPNKIADNPPYPQLVEQEEQFRFAPKNVGVRDEGKGTFSFKRFRQESNIESVGKEPGVIDKIMGNLFGLAGRVQLVDQYAALDEVTKRGLSAGQISSAEATNAQYLLRFGQQVSQFAGQFLTNGPVRMETTTKDGITSSLYRSTKGASMKDVAEALKKSGYGNDTEQEAAFTLYVAGQRADVVGWDKLNFENPAKAQAEYNTVMAKLRLNPQTEAAFKEANQKYQEYNAGLVDFLVDTGTISNKRAAELKSTPYVPFYRVAKNGEVQLMIDKEHPIRISNIKDQPELKTLLGGNTAILPIFTSAAQNTFMLTRMGLRNQAVKETSFMLQKIGMTKAIRKGTGPADKSVVRFKRKGEDYYAIIDKDMFDIPAELVVRGMEGVRTTIPTLLRVLGMPTTLLRNFVVRSPAYAVRQLIRDPLNAWLLNGLDGVPVLGSMKEMGKMIAGRSEAERKLMETGAISSNVYTGDERDMQKFLAAVSTGRSGWDKAMARFDAFALQGDATTRAVIYNDSLKKGMTEQEALLRTLESMNFSRRGVSPSMQFLNMLIPFFNAQVQGLDVMYRAFKGDMPFNKQLELRTKMVRRGVLLAGMTVLYSMLMEDDEAYKRARPQERYSSWFVYVPGVDEPLRVPIPFEMGFLFKALPEAVMNAAFQDDKASKALDGILGLVKQAIPLSFPQALKPGTELVLNRSFYSDAPIESTREQSVLPQERVRDNTTELSKFVSKVTGGALSPLQLDHLLYGHTSGLGVALVQLANPLIPTDTVDVEKPTTKISRTPFIGGLFQPVEGRGTLDEAYDRMDELRKIKGTVNRMVEQGRRAEALQFAQENADQLALMSVSGKVQQRLGALAKKERQIKASPVLTTAQKDAMLKQIDEQKMRIARQFLGAGR